jgi:hypothetical protein
MSGCVPLPSERIEHDAVDGRDEPDEPAHQVDGLHGWMKLPRWLQPRLRGLSPPGLPSLRESSRGAAQVVAAHVALFAGGFRDVVEARRAADVEAARGIAFFLALERAVGVAELVRASSGRIRAAHEFAGLFVDRGRGIFVDQRRSLASGRCRWRCRSVIEVMPPAIAAATPRPAGAFASYSVPARRSSLRVGSVDVQRRGAVNFLSSR